LAKETSPDQPVNSFSSENLIKEFDALIEWLDELEKYENCPPEGILDRNSKKSYGALCFQMETFKHYFKKYYPEAKDLEEQEWFNLITDNELQKELAYKMLKDNPNNWRNWYWSIEIRGLPKPPKL
jgi:hypothetical protein